MIQLTEEISSQENMQAWLSQVENPESTIVRNNIISLLQLGLVSCDFENRSAEFLFRVQDWQLNPEKGLHGGILVTGFDISFGLLCHYFAKQHMVSTISINTTFLKPIRPTDVIHFRVRITHLGHTVYQLVGEAYLERENILAATSSASFIKLHQTFEQPI